jgi:hypothetical protein
MVVWALLLWGHLGVYCMALRLHRLCENLEANQKTCMHANHHRGSSWVIGTWPLDGDLCLPKQNGSKRVRFLFFSFGRQVNLLPITESFWGAHHYQFFLKAMSSESGKGGIMTENESWNL